MAPEQASPVTLPVLTLIVDGMSCAACQTHVQKVLSELPGVTRAEVSLLTRQATISFADAKQTAALPTVGALIQVIEEAGYEAHVSESHALAAQADLEAAQEKEVAALRTKTWVALVGASIAMVVSMPLMAMPSGAMPSAAAQVPGHVAGHVHQVAATGPTHDPLMAWISGWLDPPIRAVFPWLYQVSPAILGWALCGWTALMLMTVGRDFFVRAIGALRHRTTDMNTLVAIGTASAFGYSLFALLFPAALVRQGLRPDGYFESALFVLAFVLLGRLFEARAKVSTTLALRKLAALQPNTAHRIVQDSGKEEDVSIDVLSPGDHIAVRPFERFPVDGEIVEGTGSVDESMLTGESRAVAKTAKPAGLDTGPTAAAHRVFGGTVNGGSSFVISATNLGERSFLSGILRLLRTAQGSRAPLEALTDRVTRWFVPGVLVIAALTFVGWSLVRGPSSAFGFAVAVLVIACPCAMGLAVPTAVVVAAGKAASLGVLARGGQALERAAGIDTIVFDKTGTLTVGKPTVTEVVFAAHLSQSEQAAVLERISAVEARSEHPLAQAITSYQVTSKVATQVVASPGLGVTGMVDTHKVLVGTADFLAAAGVDLSVAPLKAGSSVGATTVFAAIDGTWVAQFSLEDDVRPEAAEVVAHLKAKGYTLHLLSGDRAAAAQAIAKRLGIEHVQAEVLPKGKTDYIQALQAKGHKVAMVGDGVNDAPALALSDMGVAMGTGSEVSRSAADFTLLRADLRMLESTLGLSKRTLAVIRQNLVWAFGYNVLALPLAAGLLFKWNISLTPAVASMAMAMSSVSVVGNSLRLRFFKG